MKRLLLLLLISPILTFAQKKVENEFGKIVNDTLFLNNGAKFIVGEKVKLGYGVNSRKEFEFIYTSPLGLAGKVNLGNTWAGHSFVIKGFKNMGMKKTGHKFYLILGGGNITNYWCDVVPAIDHKEIVVAGINDKDGDYGGSETSIADELKKLKNLLDDGAITNDEYESQKKKLLDKN